jgi:hypothetical protein
LSCDFHPDSIRLRDERNDPDLRQFWKRFYIALANAQAGTLQLVSRGPKTTLGFLANPDGFMFVVNLDIFAAWAQGLRVPWEMPKDFPMTPKADHPANSGDAAIAKTWPWGEYSDGWLSDLAAAVDEFWKDYDPKVQGGKDRSKEAVLKFLYGRTDSRGERISETKAKAIDTIIRPKAWPTGPSKGRSFPKEKRSEKKG